MLNLAPISAVALDESTRFDTGAAGLELVRTEWVPNVAVVGIERPAG